MHPLRSVMLLGIALSLGCFCMPPSATAKRAKKWHGRNWAKNIIFMVPDGQGLSNVTAARIFKDGPEGEPLHQETLEGIGYQRTHSRNSTVTDSAAAASAWASGAKYNNGEISCHDDDFDGFCDGEPAPTILDIARSKGKATGLVATCGITQATPAAFGANVHNRKCEEEIGRQFLEREIDVLLGAGLGANRSPCSLTPSESGYFDVLVGDFLSAGYAIVYTEDQMNTAVNGGARKLLGLLGPFESGGKTPEMFRVDPLVLYPEDEPTLPEMTAAALDILEEDRDGLFLLVEGSQVDWANHANNAQYQIAEALAFDDAVKVVLDWVNAYRARKNHTLVIIVADHDSGGFAVNGPYNILLKAGDMVEAQWTTSEHTGMDTIIYSQGPGSEHLRAAIDNTDLYYVMKSVLR